ATGEIDHQAVGHVALGQSNVLGPRSVNVDIEGRIGARLLDACIGDPGDPPEPAQKQVRVLEIGGKVWAADLDIDGCRRAEIQDLADDVGWQKGEAHTRKQD